MELNFCSVIYDSGYLHVAPSTIFFLQAENELRRIHRSSCDETAMRNELVDINEANALEMAMAKSVNIVNLPRGVQRV